MFSTDKHKICPRCRFTLAKTHSEKMICKRCGYTSNKLQIVRQQEAFQSNFKFAKKIHLNKIKSQIVDSDEDRLSIYLSHFQDFMRLLIKQFCYQKLGKNPTQRDKLISTCKQLWFEYLSKMNKNNLAIKGKIGKLINKSKREKIQAKVNKQQQNSQSSDSSKSDDSEGSDIGDEQQNQLKRNKRNKSKAQRMDQQNESQNQEDHVKKQSEKISNKNKNKKQSVNNKSKQQKDEYLIKFRRFFNKKWKQCDKNSKNQNKDLGEYKLSSLFLKQILDQFKTCGADPSFQSIMYLSQKQVLLMCFQLKQAQILNGIEKGNNPYPESKYSRIQEIKQLCEIRKLKYQKRRLFTQISLLTYQLLAQWLFSENNSIELRVNLHRAKQLYPFEYLLHMFRISPSHKPAFIVKLVGYLETMSQQMTIKYEQEQKQAPQISCKFVCGLIYLACLFNEQCFHILEIVNFATQHIVYLCKQHIAQYDSAKREVLQSLLQENVRVRKTRKVTNSLIKFLQCQIGNKEQQHLYFNKWCDYYSNVFNIPKAQAIEWRIMTKTLLKGYIYSLQNNSNRFYYNGSSFHTTLTNANRYLISEQPQIILSSLIMYSKIKFGLQRQKYPYLVNFLNLFEYIKESDIQFYKEDGCYQKVSELIAYHKEQQNIREKFLFNQFGLIYLLEQINRKSTKLKVVHNGKDIGYLDLKQLKCYVQAHGKFSGDKNLVMMHKAPQLKVQNTTNSIKQLAKENKTQYRFKDYFKRQIQILHEKLGSSQYRESHPEHIQPPQYGQHGPQQQQRYQDDHVFSFKEELQQWVDRPYQSYQIIYSPSINSLKQLKLDELMCLSEKMSFYLLGQESNCKELIEWTGYLEQILVQFQNKQ